MITGEHSFIRATEPDDAHALHQLYGIAAPRAALLDSRREPVLPTPGELREILGHKDAQSRGVFFTIEDRAGTIRGFCTLREMPGESRFGEAGYLFLDDAGYASPIADEMARFVEERAFTRLSMRKLVAQCLESEEALRVFLEARGFASDGRQREALFAGGRWLDMLSYTRFAPPQTPAPNQDN